MFFKCKKEKLFIKHQNNILNYIENSNKYDKTVFLKQIIKNNAIIISMLYPNAPIDNSDVTGDKIELINKFIYYVNNEVIPLPNSMPTIYVKYTKVLPIIRNLKNQSKFFSYSKQFFNEYNYRQKSFCSFIENMDNDEYTRYIEKIKNKSVIENPLLYTSFAYNNIETLQVGLLHSLALTKNIELDYDRLMLLLTVQQNYDKVKRELYEFSLN